MAFFLAPDFRLDSQIQDPGSPKPHSGCHAMPVISDRRQITSTESNNRDMLQATLFSSQQCFLYSRGSNSCSHFGSQSTNSGFRFEHSNKISTKNPESQNGSETETLSQAQSLSFSSQHWKHMRVCCQGATALCVLQECHLLGMY